MIVSGNPHLGPSIPKLLIASTCLAPPSQSSVFDSAPLPISDPIQRKTYGELYNEKLVEQQQLAIIEQRDVEMKVRERSERRAKREAQRLRKQLARMQREKPMNHRHCGDRQQHTEPHSEPNTHRMHRHRDISLSESDPLDHLMFDDSMDVRTIRSCIIDKQINEHQPRKRDPMTFSELYTDSSHYDSANVSEDECSRSERDYHNRNSAKKLFTNVDNETPSLWSKPADHQSSPPRAVRRRNSYDEDERHTCHTPSRSRRSPLRGRGYNGGVSDAHSEWSNADVRSIWSSLSLHQSPSTHRGAPAQSQSVWSQPSTAMRRGTQSRYNTPTSSRHSRHHPHHAAPMMPLSAFAGPSAVAHSPFKPLLTHSTAIIQSNHSDDNSDNDNVNIRRSSPMVQLSPVLSKINAELNGFSLSEPTAMADELLLAASSEPVNVRMLSVKQINDKWNTIFNDGENDSGSGRADQLSIKSLNSIVRQTLLSSPAATAQPVSVTTAASADTGTSSIESQAINAAALPIQLHPAIEAELNRLRQQTIQNLMAASAPTIPAPVPAPAQPLPSPAPTVDVDRLVNDLSAIKQVQNQQEEKILQRLEQIENQVKKSLTSSVTQSPAPQSQSASAPPAAAQPAPVTSPFNSQSTIQNDLYEMDRQLNKLENTTNAMQHTLGVPLTVSLPPVAPAPAPIPVLARSPSPLTAARSVSAQSAPAPSPTLQIPSESQTLEAQRLLREFQRALSGPPAHADAQRRVSVSGNVTKRSSLLLRSGSVQPVSVSVPTVTVHPSLTPVPLPTPSPSPAQPSPSLSPSIASSQAVSPASVDKRRLESLKAKMKSQSPTPARSMATSRRSSVNMKSTGKKPAGGGVSSEEARLFAEAQSLIAQFRSEFPDAEVKHK